MKKLFLLPFLLLLLASCEKDDGTKGRADRTESFRLDSMYTWTIKGPADSILSEKVHYIYDEQGRNTCTIGFDYARNQVIAEGAKEERDYNSTGELSMKRTYRWSISTSQWILSSKVTYFFDFENRLTGFEVNVFDWMGLPMGGSNKVEYQFNKAGNRIASITYDWTQQTDSWFESGKSLDSTDNSGRLLESIIFSLDTTTNKYDKRRRIICAYDPDGNLIKNEEDSWHIDHWLVVRRVETIFDPWQNPLSEVIYSENDFGFIIMKRITLYSYTTEGFPDKIEIYVQQGSNEVLSLAQLSEYKYTEDGRRLLIVVSSINGDIRERVNVMEMFRSKHTAGTVSSLNSRNDDLLFIRDDSELNQVFSAIRTISGLNR